MTAYNKYGWDRHVWDTKPEEFRPGMQVTFASWILFATASALTKLSLLAFYKRLLPSNARIYGWILYTSMLVVTILGFNNVFEVVFMCRYVDVSVKHRPLHTMVSSQTPNKSNIASTVDLSTPS